MRNMRKYILGALVGILVGALCVTVQAVGGLTVYADISTLVGVSKMKAADSVVAVNAESGISEVAVNTESGASEGVKSITSAVELMAIANEPAGSYRLDKDIDMAGIEWVPFAFGGTLDGNGHAILNLSFNVAGSEVETSYDGNYKEYDTYFAGMFSIVSKDASITNLKLINVRATLESDQPVFVGGFAGYLEGGTIDGCNVSGTLSLTTSAKTYGVGGIVGYGYGTISDTDAVVTLITTDTDKTVRDEQFLGGAFATGYVDMKDCNITVHGYISEHGYVHSGGLTGMYMFYPKEQRHSGSITGCHVDGFITFFEDNTDRRAYCKAYWGELLSTTVSIRDCTDTFEAKEVRDYSRDLLPEMCEKPVYEAVVTESTDNLYGYTTYTCSSCGYSYTDNYTLHASDLKELAEQQSKEEELLSLDDGAMAASNKSSADWTNRQSLSEGALICVLAAAIVIITAFAVLCAAKKRKRERRRKGRR